jgi:hypothetical protein
VNVRALPVLLALAILPAQASAEMLFRAKPGAELVSLSKACRVELRDAPLKATLLRDGNRVAEVTGVGEVSWVGNLLVYSVSPIHGKSGIYAWRCSGGAPLMIVKPTRSTGAYPDGADFFKLIEIQGQTLRYAHARDAGLQTLEHDLEKRRKTLSLRPFIDKPAREKP